MSDLEAGKSPAERGATSSTLPRSQDGADDRTTTKPPRATFFLSTGRCGTQWLAASLAEHYGDMATVDHEPMSAD